MTAMFNAGSSTMKLGLAAPEGDEARRIDKGMIDFRKPPLRFHLLDGPARFGVKLEADPEAGPHIVRYGRPDIFNTDQGSQFTSFAFTTTLRDAGVRISMDGCGRWIDNVFIERLWRSLKYECVFLNAFETGSEARAGIGSWIDYDNRRRPHSTFDGRTPDEVYARVEMTEKLAA